MTTATPSADSFPITPPMDMTNPVFVAIEEEWARKRPKIQALQETWLRRSVDCGAPIQSHAHPWIDWKEGDRSRSEPPWVLVVPLPALRKLKKLLYEPKCPPAVDDHRRELQRIASKLHDIANRLMADMEISKLAAPSRGEHEAIIQALRGLAVAYSELDGCYYLLQEPKSKDRAEETQPKKHYMDNWRARKSQADVRRDTDLLWAIEIAMKGIPKNFANFHIEPLFVLEKQDGMRVRMLNIHTAAGEHFGFNVRKPRSESNQPLQLTGENGKSPTHLREFLMNHGGGTWAEGERALQALSSDLDMAFAWKTVREVTSWGYHSESRAYFGGDCAITEDGEILTPNRYGYYHIKREKYMSSERDREGQQFHHGAPLWHPEVKLDPLEVRQMWEGTTLMMFGAIGTFEALIAMGLTMSYSVAAEVFAKHKGFPGLWIHGEARAGKSWLGRWLMRFYGYQIDAGVTLGSTSVVGSALVVQQYSNLPAWFEEFQTDTVRQQVEMLKGFFDRSAGAKKLTNLREILTSPIVSGQATSNDAATRSRYPHVQVSANRRLPRPQFDEVNQVWIRTEEQARKEQSERFEWLQSNMDKFWWFGRWALQNRREFAKAHEAAMILWKAAPEVREITDERAKLVYGVAFSGYHAMTTLLGLEAEENIQAHLQSFLKFCAAAAANAVAEVRQQNELERFWQKVEGCFTLRGFGDTKEDLRRFFRAIPSGELARPPGVPEESTQRGAWIGRSSQSTTWISWEIEINYNALSEALKKHARSQGEDLPLRMMDVTSQMKDRPYWRQTTAPKARFSGSIPSRFWRIGLDQFDLGGYRQSTDEEVSLAFHCDQRMDDPRLGWMYRLVQQLTRDPEGSGN